MPEQPKGLLPLDTLDPAWDSGRTHAHLGRFTGYRPAAKRCFTNFGVTIWKVENRADKLLVVPRTSPSIVQLLTMTSITCAGIAGGVAIWMYMPLGGVIIGTVALILGIGAGWVQLASVTWMKKGAGPLAEVDRRAGSLVAQPPVGTVPAADIVRVEHVRVSYRSPDTTFFEWHLVLCVRCPSDPGAVRWVPLDASGSSGTTMVARLLAEALRVPCQEARAEATLDW